MGRNGYSYTDIRVINSLFLYLSTGSRSIIMNLAFGKNFLIKSEFRTRGSDRLPLFAARDRHRLLSPKISGVPSPEKRSNVMA